MTDENELPGMLAVAKGVAEQKWPHTMDAQVWVKEWMKTIAEIPPGSEKDEGFMLGWFANAIMAGYDTACAQLRAEAPRAEWVPCGDRLPENEDYCLAFIANRATGLSAVDVRFIYAEDRRHLMNPMITHWMPLPALPSPEAAKGDA